MKSDGFEQGLGQPRLTNDAEEGAPPHRVMKWDRDRDRRAFSPLLHDPVAATLADGDESVQFENLTNLRA